MIIASAVTDAAEAVSDFLDALRNTGLGPEITQQITISTAPTIVRHVLLTHWSNGN